MHKKIMDHASKAAAASRTQQTNSTASIQAVNSFMYRPTLSSVAAPTVSDTSDPIKARIKDHDEFPTHHPKEMREGQLSVRFHFKCSNVPELLAMLDFLLSTYRIHHTNKHCDEASREQMERYLTDFPLGINQPEFTDTAYYSNANKMSQVIHANTALPAGTAPAPLPEPVLTTFAQSHVALQKHIYLSLRANYHRFMDKPSTIVMDNIIETYERDNGLTGEERLEPGKRYSWAQMKADLTKMCCIATKGGYYFLPLYTTMREDGSAVQTWTNKVLSLYRLLEQHDADWAKLAQSDASHRTYAFFSKKELEVIDNFLNDLNRTKWNNANKSTYGYFEKFGIEEAIQAINKIPPNKFPSNFVAKVHTPQAIKASLYTWDKVQRIVEGMLAEHKAKASKLEAEIARLKRELATAKGTKPHRQPTTRARVAATNPTTSNSIPIDQITRSKHPEIAKLSDAAWQRLCNPNRTGANPCSECLKLGMRYFHSSCDPVRREANFKKQKQRTASGSPQKHNRQPKPFPPPENERKFKLSLYKPEACPNCKREDVDPKYCNHPGHVCYRRKGGECDKEGAVSRRDRALVVSRMAKQRAQNNQSKKTTLAQRVHDTANDNPDSPRGGVKFTGTAQRVHGTTAQTTPGQNQDPETPGAAPSVIKRTAPQHAGHATPTKKAKSHVPPTDSSKSGKVLRTKRFPYHDLAQAQPFSKVEMDFVLRHHRANKVTQVEHDYYKQGREQHFQAVRATVNKFDVRYRPDAAHKYLSKLLVRIGAERPPEPSPRRSMSLSSSDSCSSSQSDYSDSSEYEERRSPPRRRQKRKRKRGRRKRRRRKRRRRNPLRSRRRRLDASR